MRGRTGRMNGAQLTMIAILAFNLSHAMLHHGEDKPPAKYNFYATLIAFLIDMSILTWGGFWS